MADPENRDAVAVLTVPAPLMAGKSVRVSIELPQHMLDQIDRAAEKRGFTRSGFLVAAAQREIEHAR